MTAAPIAPRPRAIPPATYVVANSTRLNIMINQNATNLELRLVLFEPVLIFSFTLGWGACRWDIK